MHGCRPWHTRYSGPYNKWRTGRHEGFNLLGTNDWNLIRRIREKYGLPQQMNINYTTYAKVDEETLAQLKKGEPKFLIIRKIEK